jgi:hypothetical protein
MHTAILDPIGSNMAAVLQGSNNDPFVRLGVCVCVREHNNSRKNGTIENKFGRVVYSYIYSDEFVNQTYRSIGTGGFGGVLYLPQKWIFYIFHM